MYRKLKLALVGAWIGALALFAVPAVAQLIDRTTAPNTVGEGINKSYRDQIGADRGDEATPYSSAFVIARDPFRAIRRGRQIFQRKFTKAQGVGPIMGDGAGDADLAGALGAGLADSCAACHARPRGAAGFGGAVATRPDSRDAPHLFGLGLKEMLADEMTADLRATRQQAVDEARTSGAAVSKALASKGISFGSITARPDGTLDTSRVEGVDADLRVRPFFAHGGTISIREFVAGALQDEMGLQVVDAELIAASRGGRVVTPSGMVLDGSTDTIQTAPTDDMSADPDVDGVAGEVPTSILDYMEFYLLNYFKPAVYEQTSETARGRRLFEQVGCATCHVPDLEIVRDRRVGDAETVYDSARGNWNGLFSTVTPLFETIPSGDGFPAFKRPMYRPFLVRNIFTDFKRHDLGPGFHEREYNGTMRTKFITTPLWGVGSTGPYGHDGRSINLMEVTLRHGGEAQASRDAFARLNPRQRGAILAFLQSLVLFPPDDTASTLDPGDRTGMGYPQGAHGSIKLAALFNDPADRE
jgi:mono/diheme cytochrome c family protein